MVKRTRITLYSKQLRSRGLMGFFTYSFDRSTELKLSAVTRVRSGIQETRYIDLKYAINLTDNRVYRQRRFL